MSSRLRQVIGAAGLVLATLGALACGDDDGSSPADAAALPDGAAAEPDAGPSLTTALIHSDIDVDSIDPALSYLGVTWQYEYLTCTTLLNYADGAEIELVPEIASAMPEVSADGLTYTFPIGTSFQLSPPSGEVVTAQTMKETFDRARDPALDSPARFFMADVASIEVTGAADDELTFTLIRPAADFLSRVAMPFFCAVPSGTPHEEQTAPVPSAGPYYVSDYTPVTYDDSGAVTATGELVIVRNPNYQGDRPHVLDEIHYVLGEDAEGSRDQVENNAVDYVINFAATPEERASLLAAYGPDSAAPRLFVNSALGYRHLVLNASRPVFADPDVRRAVQYAVDRAGFAELSDLEPDDDYLPPGLPGRAGEHPYPLDQPDLAAASALLDGAHPAVSFYVRDLPIAVEASQFLQADLEAAGFTVSLVRIPPGDFFDVLGQPDEPFDLVLMGWFADYPDPFDFLNLLFHSTSENNYGHFSDAAFDAELDAAAALAGTPRIEEYRRLDNEALDLSPSVVLGSLNIYSFFSERMGCQTYHPLYGMNLAMLCIK